MVMGKAKREKCRSCGGELAPGAKQESRWYPFCSERCRWLDLGAWFKQEYSLGEENSVLNGREDSKNPKSDKE